MSTETLPKPEIEFTDYDLDQFNIELEQMDPIERIAWARQRFGDGLIATTAFGLTSPLMLKFISEVDPGIQVVTVRMGHETDKTKTLAKWYEGVFDLNLAVHGDHIQVVHDAEALRARKVELFQREVVDRYQPEAVLFGVMRDQTVEREAMSYIERRGSFLAINPVLDVTAQEVDDFFKLSGYPKNMNYSDPTKGPDQKMECGIHLTRFS
ncbi:phosphoadenosine phosphosulfate reductase family protein [Candidatus Saccharibacteria bacterium]|nr:phosphoadenosine phosphosulfate reductase family protein [Candidatus Saccharibacteria bacterium]